MVGSHQSGIDLFVSYSRKDVEKIERLVKEFKKRNFDVFWDREIPPGGTWDTHLRSKISAARCLLVLWSEHSVDSNVVKNEVREAQANSVPVVAAFLHGEVKLPLDQGHAQAVDLQGEVDNPLHRGFSSLVETVKEHVDSALRSSNNTSRGRALVVGVSEFSDWDGLPEIKTARSNIDEITRVLLTPECEYDHVEGLIDPDIKTLKKKLQMTFQEAAAGEQILLYYCGYAAIDSSGDLFLCARDTEPDLIDATALGVSGFLKQRINKTQSDRIVVVLDCCFIPTTKKLSATPDVKQVLLDQFGRGRGVYLITATTKTGQPVEAAEGTMSRFSKAFVDGLRSDDTDSNDDGIVTIEELWIHIKRRFEENFPEQRPEGKALDINARDLVVLRREKGPSDPLEPQRIEFLNTVTTLVKEGKVIPFLGSGIYGSGPLSTFALSGAMLSEEDVYMKSDCEVATAAQYLQEGHEDRDVFLTQFRRVLENQCAVAQPPAVHDLILELSPPLLLVSATYDFLLEKRLEENGRDHLIVSHILRSNAGKYDGRLLCVRRGANPSVTIHLSDEFLYDEEIDFVIYKVLGSPYLNELVEPAWGVDTVVATEDDHMALLVNLSDDSTSVPTAFSVPFEKEFIFFIGYTLDVWHYRLIAQIFKRYKKKKRYAVRQPVSIIEESCWRSLDVRMIKEDPNALADLLRRGIS